MRRKETSLPLEITEGIRSGDVLAGDDLEGEALRRWYAQEKEAYQEHDADAGKNDPVIPGSRSPGLRRTTMCFANRSGRSLGAVSGRR